MSVSDFMKSAGGILATIAPTVATAMGGPLAGMATTALINGLGLAPDASHEQVMQAIAGATPEQLLKIKQIDAQLVLDLRKLDVDVTKMRYDDTANARGREIATKDWTPRILAGLVVGLYIGVQIAVFNVVIDPSMRDFVMRSMGTLDAALGLVLGYYFGSSTGSAAKTEQLSTVINAEVNGKK
jgi:hypothetical protein